MRIVSLAPSNTEILFELGAGDRIVATTSLCDYPEEARDKPSIGGWTNPKVDRLEEFDPDLVLASDDLQNRAVEKIRSEGFEVFQVKPHSLEEVFQSIRDIGKRIGKENRAEELAESMRSQIEDVCLEGRRIYCEEWMDPPMVSGNWVPQLIEKAGGEYFIKEGRSREFELEDLKSFDPEHIFLSICGAGVNLEPKEVRKRDDWKDIQAVRDRKIHVLDDSLLNRPGPRLVEAAEKIEEICREG